MISLLDENDFLVSMGDPTPGSIFATKRKFKPDPIDKLVAEQYGPAQAKYAFL